MIGLTDVYSHALQRYRGIGTLNPKLESYWMFAYLCTSTNYSKGTYNLI